MQAIVLPRRRGKAPDMRYGDACDPAFASIGDLDVTCARIGDRVMAPFANSAGEHLLSKRCRQVAPISGMRVSA